MDAFVILGSGGICCTCRRRHDTAADFITSARLPNDRNEGRRHHIAFQLDSWRQYCGLIDSSEVTFGIPAFYAGFRLSRHAMLNCVNAFRLTFVLPCRHFTVTPTVFPSYQPARLHAAAAAIGKGSFVGVTMHYALLRSIRMDAH